MGINGGSYGLAVSEHGEHLCFNYNFQESRFEYLKYEGGRGWSGCAVPGQRRILSFNVFMARVSSDCPSV